MNIGSSRVEERGRPRPVLYGDTPPRETTRRTSYSPGSVSVSKKILPDDIRWSNGRQPRSEKEQVFAKPALGRHATHVY